MRVPRDVLVAAGLGVVRWPAPDAREGPTAVLLHGLGSSAAIWPLPRLLRIPLATVLVDLPGHGRSHVPWPATLAETAALVAAALRELGVGPTVLVGHSLGAAVALHLDQLQERRNRGTLLIGAGCEIRGMTSPDAAARFRAQPDEWIRATVEVLFGDHLPETYRRAAAAGFARVGAGTMAAALESLSRFDPRSLAGLAPAPRIVVSGAADPIVSRAAARELATAIGAAHREIEGAGHFVFLERPDGVQLALDALLARLEPHRAAPGPAAGFTTPEHS
jgi:pimeloyl-ACP methyl ester carboxylesterase